VGDHWGIGGDHWAINLDRYYLGSQFSELQFPESQSFKIIRLKIISL
jgi:hypothetical protein